MPVFDLTLYVVLVALSAASIVPVVRALPGVQGWVQRGIKPWACDLCMSFWSTIFTTTVWMRVAGLPWYVGWPAFAVAFAVVRFNGAPTSSPSTLLELKDLEKP